MCLCVLGGGGSNHVEIRGQFVEVTFLLPSYGFQKTEFSLSGLETYSTFPPIFPTLIQKSYYHDTVSIDLVFS